MHSYSNTRLAQFGFQDPDRKLKKHALACQYLSRRSKKIVVACALGDFESEEARCEAALSKGEGQYKTTIGFIDVQFEEVYDVASGPGLDEFDKTRVVGIEVKITPCAWDVALRQINLYREYAPTIPGKPSARPKRRWSDAEEPLSFWYTWVLAVAYPMSTSDIEALRVAGVRVLRLGEKFESWLERREHKKNAELPEV